MIKRVAVMHVPRQTNRGSDQPTGLINTLRRRLDKLFGGHHASNVEGSWIDEEGRTILEPMLEIKVAMEATANNSTQWFLIAGDVARDFDQKLVYIVHWDGVVELVPPSP